MIYLSNFSFPNMDEEDTFLLSGKRTCYDTYYPFHVISKHGLSELEFAPITVLYGGNGSGKTTVLNVIAEKLRIARDTRFNRTNFFDDYINMCEYQLGNSEPEDCRVITSDDVFDFMLNLRTINDGIDMKREELFEEYLDEKYSKFQMRSLDDYEQLKRVNMARSKTQSKYIRKHLMGNIREHSNGESAFIYFFDKIKESGLYLLDEPENSLSPEKQLELLKFIEDSARYLNCQFIIATHSPFLLAMNHTKIYDMDEEPVCIKKWTELPNVLAYYDFFKKHKDEFS